jgi:hypothetical protein
MLDRPGADAEKMGEAALAANAAAKQKNLEALVAANSTLVESCESCHKAFKPDLPTEGATLGDAPLESLTARVSSQLP